MNLFSELSAIAGTGHKVGKACFSSVATYHAASTAASRANSMSPSRRPSSLSATNSHNSEDAARQWEPSWQMQMQADMFRGNGSGSGGMFGSGGSGGSGRSGFGGGGGHNNPFPSDSGANAQQFLFVGLKPDHASTFVGAVWHFLSVVCMMQTFGFLLYGDFGAGDVFQDERFDTVEI